MSSLSSSFQLSTITAFTTQLLNMSTTSIKQLKQYVIKTMEDNLLLPFDSGHLSEEEEKDLHQQKHNQQINKQKIDLLINTFTQSYKQKQLQVDTLANFILQFLSSLEDVYQQMKFKDKRINSLKETIDQQTDVIKGLEDDVQQYMDRLNNAEDYIHWMEEECQYFDLLCISNPRYDLLSPSLSSSSSSRQLSKCRSQKTFTSSYVASSTTSLSSSQIHIQNTHNNSNIQQKRKKKLDYDRIKFYIESLKQQKNYLIKEYNMLLDQHQRKLFECEKHSVLLGELFEKYKGEAVMGEGMVRVAERKKLNGKKEEGVVCVNCEGTNNNIDRNRPTTCNNISQYNDTQQISICLHHNKENPQILQSKIIQQQSHSRNTLKMEYDQSFISGNNSIVNSFISDIYERNDVKMDVGVNTKKGYFVNTMCQTDLSSYQNNNVIDGKKVIKLKQKQDSSPTSSFINNNTQSNNNSNINCQISINLKNLSTFQQIKKINFSKLITKQVLASHHHNKDNNNNNNNNSGYTTTCHRQKNKQKKHLCQHIYCFLTNKVVTERIKKYKYGMTANNNRK